MKILVLWNKKTWDTKMSPVRRDAVLALQKHHEVELKITGPGWEGFSGCANVDSKYKPDLVFWYKPLGMKDYDKVKAPKCLSFNEMWDREWTKKEIVESNSELVVCHHLNDIPKYRGKLPPKFKLVNVPHCAEKRIFKNYELKKDIDVLLVGVRSKRFYPLRNKIFKGVLPILKSKDYRVGHHKHPGYKLKGLDAINRQVVEYAKAINRAKIVVTCSSVYKYALAKYVEIPMCRSVLCGDIPGENQEWYRKWMLEISNEISAEDIAKKIIKVLKNPEHLNILKRKGYQENLNKRTQEDYANRFVGIATDFLKGK
ncbi:MAG: hypothetical protein GY861_12665 [bacterium]|nr:hypothetical protein [bacterium]